ncbi:universal stress protein [Streptomyces sp. NPDC002845]
MESVLVGVDHSESSRRAVKFALERARVNQWRMSIAYVINWSPYNTFRTQQDNEARPVVRKAEIERAQAEVIDPILSWAESEKHLGDVEVTPVIRHGRPSEVLADIAAEGGHDLIVVGRTGESNLRTAIFGSTAYRLVQHAPVAVVVVP